jgi:Mg/Co/Ni transporter MgtE
VSAAANPFREGARMRKVYAILSVLDRLPDPPSADEVSKWDETVWTSMAGAADVNLPSAATRAMVVEHLRAREAEAEHVTEIDVFDPFEDAEADTVLELFGGPF